ncbi:TATA-box-binding protein-like [Mugil cephalus]|uniref:TATA-box-binding protein-like n=1 Tax=Mugil cephalus TaxID=48193 RepID=UPI001FB66F34|nr:TATA-box-binding protein-like [Mugil cephalus]
MFAVFTSRNVISTVKLGCSLDLDLIACKSWNVEYNPKIYKALVMRIREPRATALIYKNGNLVCTGAKSVEQSLLAARKFARIVQKLGFPVASLDFKIRNMVATCSTFPVCLDQLATSHHQLCSYEPELFPGLFYKIIPGVNVTVFPSGKINMCGAKTLDNVYEAFHALYPILRNFRRK